MACIASRKFWPPWKAFLLALLVLGNFGTMVKLTDAILQSSANGSSASLLSHDGVKKHTLKLKKDADKNLDALTAREIKERFMDFSYIDSYVKRINGLTLFGTIRNAKETCLKHGTRLNN